MILSFPNLNVLRLALTAGAVPANVALAAAKGALDEQGQAWIESSVVPGKAELRELKKLGVQTVSDSPMSLEPLVAWPQLLPLEPAGNALLGDKVPVLFELADETLLPELVGEILRLGNDRQSFRWLEGEATGRALLRVIGPPYYSLLRAFDRQGPSAYREVHGRVWVQVGYTHPLAEQIRPPAGKLLLMRQPRQWTFVDEARFRDIYDILDFALPEEKAPWQDVDLSRRLTVPLRLAPSGSLEPAELWVLRDNPVAQLDDFVQSADDHLLGRLSFAVAENAGQRLVVVRVRPSKLAPPVLVLNGVGYRSYLRLSNLFLPCDQRLHPPLRRDAVSRLLAGDTTRINWLHPQAGGRFTPESVPDEAFRPLTQWVDYVLDQDNAALTAWVQANRFDFASFICRDDQPAPSPPKPPARPKKAKAAANKKEAAEEAILDEEEPAKPRRGRQEEPVADFTLPEPSELEKKLRELETAFLTLKSPLDSRERQELWLRLAQVNGALNLKDAAAICWANALWESDAVPRVWLKTWLDGEKNQETPAALPSEIIHRSFPQGPDLRALIIHLLRATQDTAAAAVLKPLLGDVQKYLEQHEGLLGIRLLWLGWWALHELSQGDVLALARARDRLLERLYLNGLSADLDLPSFLRFSSKGGAGDRFHQVHEHLMRLRPMVQQWLNRDRLPTAGNSGTFMYADLIFAYALARLGETNECRKLLHAAGQHVPVKDAVHAWLFQAYDARINSVLEAKPFGGRLPRELIEALKERERFDDTGLDAESLKALKSQVLLERYKIDRLREHSRILEPHEKIDPYRHWHGHFADDLSKQLSGLADVTDHGELGKQLKRLLAPVKGKPPVGEARILATALELAPRLGEAFAGDLLEKVGVILPRAAEPLEQVMLLEKALFLAGHYDKHDEVQDLVARFHGFLEKVGGSAEAGWPIQNLESLLGHTFRSLRKLGLRDQVGQLLDRLTAIVHANPEFAGAKAANHAKEVRLLLHIASGWFFFGQNDRARPILDQARTLLLKGELFHVDKTALACAYVAALGRGPLELALPRVIELFRKIKGISDTFTVNSHYSLSRLDLIEATVLALVNEDFNVTPEARRLLDDDEYLVRRRIHRDVKKAMETAGV